MIYVKKNHLADPTTKIINWFKMKQLLNSYCAPVLGDHYPQVLTLKQIKNYNKLAGYHTKDEIV